MNYKEKIEEILDLHFRNRNHYNFSGLSEAITSLLEQAQRDAVEGFANWVYENYNEGEIKMYGDGEDLSINLLCRFYLNQTKEDINPKEGE